MLAVNLIVIGLIGAFLMVFCFLATFAFGFGRPWLRAKNAGLNLSMINIMSMSVLKVSPSVLIDAMIRAKEAGIVEADETLNMKALMNHKLAGGDPARVIAEMCEQQRLASVPQTFEEMAVLELAGKPPFDFSI